MTVYMKICLSYNKQKKIEEMAKNIGMGYHHLYDNVFALTTTKPEVGDEGYPEIRRLYQELREYYTKHPWQKRLFEESFGGHIMDMKFFHEIISMAGWKGYEVDRIDYTIEESCKCCECGCVRTESVVEGHTPFSEALMAWDKRSLINTVTITVDEHGPVKFRANGYVEMFENTYTASIDKVKELLIYGMKD